MEKIKGIYIDSNTASASVIEFEPTPTCRVDLVGGIYAANVKRVINDERYMLTYDISARYMPQLRLMFDDKLDGIYGNILITKAGVGDELISIDDDAIDGVLTYLEKEQFRDVVRYAMA